MKYFVFAFSLLGILVSVGSAQKSPKIVRMKVERKGGAGTHGALAIADQHIKMMGPAMLVSGGVVKGAPYSAEAVTEMVQRLADGNTIRRESSTKLYRDSEGRTRREDQIGGIGPWATGGSKSIVFIHDPVAGVQYILHPDGKTAEKISMPQLSGELDFAVAAADSPVIRHKLRIIKRKMDEHGVLAESVEESHVAGGAKWTQAVLGIVELSNPFGADADQTKESLGTRSIAGVEASGTRQTTTIPAGTIGNEQPIEISSERWYSDELQIEMMTKRSDPRSGETTYELRNLQRVEPLRSLFEVPADYVVNEQNVFLHREE